ncbi:Hypothetical protein PBC10988_7310 [Planctomycetales bacterium 10988]|nr:Hypothetical protein PBC10988_7310 [Planctomycetales bacterium 10988]
MTWFKPFSQHSERHHRTRLRQQKETALQLETLEDRHLLSAAEPFLIDINQVGISSNPKYLTDVNGTLFFSANSDPATGQELWKSDGTIEGTQIVKNIYRGARGSEPRFLTEVNGKVFFSANSLGSEKDLWVSDGTCEGTRLVKDLYDESSVYLPDNLINVNGTLFFRAYHQSYGSELWRSDGTSEGTFVVRDILPGSDSPSLQNFANIDGILYFSADDDLNGKEIWRSDGTSQGTYLLKALVPGGLPTKGPEEITNVNGTIYFAAYAENFGPTLWMSDGTSEGTLAVKDINEVAPESPAYLTNINGTLFFSAVTEISGRELWRSDSTSSGTHIVKEIREGNEGTAQTHLTNVNGTLYFRAFEDQSGYDLWMSDGTSNGTKRVDDIVPGVPGHHSYKTGVRYLTNVNGSLFFVANDGSRGYELWMNTGSSAGSQLVKDLFPGPTTSLPEMLVNLNGTLFFTANDGSSGTEIWRSDGTLEGTILVKDVRPETMGSVPDEFRLDYWKQPWFQGFNDNLIFFASNGYSRGLWSSDGTTAGTQFVAQVNPGEFRHPHTYHNFNNTLFFSGREAGTGVELWMTDGTVSGTKLVKDIRTGDLNSYPRYLTVVNNTLFFRAINEITGAELWMTDGTSEGTKLVSDLVPGTESSLPTELYDFNNTLFFVADDGTSGRELWRSDGSSEGTILIKDINLGEAGSNPSELKSINGTLYFSAHVGSTGYELWMTDGTSEGTRLVRDINIGEVSSDPHLFFNMNGTFLFLANDGVHGEEIWTSDGTGEGTQLLKDIRIGSGTSSPSEFILINETLFFQANDTFAGSEIWMTDGTSKGTVLVSDIFPGTAGSNPTELTEFNGSVFFRARNRSSDIELWKSDGTSNGTQLVKDIDIGENNSSPNGLTNVNGLLYFDARTDLGSELWVSDGTYAGTELVVDLNPDIFSSFPENLTNVNGKLFFRANDQISGMELWVIEDEVSPRLNISPNQTNTNVQLVTFSFDFSERVIGFEESDIQIFNGIGSNFTVLDDNTYALDVQANGEGNIQIIVDSNVSHDPFMNGNESSSSTITYDISPPTLSLTPDPFLTNTSPILFIFEFSENIIGFIESDIVITGGMGSSFTMIDGNTYTIEVTPNSDGELTVSVADEAAEDAAGNLLVGDSATVVYDSISPTVVITPDENLTNVAMTIFTIDFSEEVSDFTIDDIQVINGTKGSFTAVDGNTYTLEITALADGDVVVTVLANGATDTVGNGNVENTSIITYDGTAPSLTISPDGGQTVVSPILFTFESSEEVFGFKVGDIVVTGGIAGTFTPVDGNIFTLEVVPAKEDGVVTVSVADAVAEDEAGNENVSDSATILYNAVDETPLIVTGTDAGSPATVRVFDTSGNEILSFMPYGESFTGGVRVATGDVNGDGILDIITAAGPGGGPHVQVFDSRTGQLNTGGLNNFYAYAPNVTTGVFVAAGDVNGDGFDDIITAPDAGGGPHLKVYNGLTGDVITEFYAYAPNVTVGVRIATGDINGDGFAEIITTPGPGGGPHVRVINGMTGEQMPGPVTNFYAYAPNVLTGLYVASGDVNGDGFDDIITSPGAGGGPHVQAFSSADGSTLQNFYAYHPNFVGGVRVGSADLNQDGFADIITVPGSSGGPHTRAFSGVDLEDLSNFFSGSPTNIDGLFLAGGIIYIPIEDPAPASAPFTSLVITSNPKTPEDITLDNLAKKKSWQDDADEFYQSAEEIDKLFSGLGVG